MRQKLDGTNIIVRDLGDQPESDFILILAPDLLGSKAALAVDFVREREGMMGAWLGTTLIASWNPDIPWVMVSRERLETFTGRTWAKRLAQDDREMRELMKEVLTTEELKVAEKIAAVITGVEEAAAPVRGGYL